MTTKTKNNWFIIRFTSIYFVISWIDSLYQKKLLINGQCSSKERKAYSTIRR